MHNLLRVLLGIALFALPSVAAAHGSNVLETADTPAHHTHDDAAAHDHSSPGTLADEIEELHGDIDRLQQQLQAHDQRARITDIVGGIGYIVGITGAAYYYFGARRRKSEGPGISG